MIALWSVSKSASRWQSGRVLLEDVNWVIGPRERVVILGHPHSGAPALIDIIAGQTFPTSGWVDRRATLSVPSGLLRFAGLDTPRQLIAHLSRLYRMNPIEVTDFVADGLGRSDVLNVSARALPAQIKQQLSVVLTFAFPFDFYLFQSPPVGNGDKRFQAFCENALQRRSREAGILVRASSSRVARKMGDDMMGALVYQGNLSLYRRLADAIAVFDSLPPEKGESLEDQVEDAVAAEADITDLF